MSVNVVNNDGSLSRVAGGTLYADAPIGTISPFGGSVIPNGYLLSDGAEVLKTTYAELYAVIGDTFGTASENTKFVLPDLRVPKKKAGSFTVPTNGNKTTLEIGFVPKVVLIEYVAKDHPEVEDVILRIFIDATGPTVYWYPQLRSNSETRNFSRHLINEPRDWYYGKIASFGENIEFETTFENDFIGKTFNYYATSEAAGTFTTSSYQYGVVDVPKSAKDANIFVSLPFDTNNLTTAFYVDCVEEMPSPSFDDYVRMSRWSIPSENRLYYIDSNGVHGDQGQTGIINSYDNHFVFRSNAPNTQGVSCTYYLMPRISELEQADEVKDVGINYIIKAKQVAVPADFMDAIDDVLNEFAKPISLVPVNNSTIYYDKSRIIGGIVTVCASIVVPSGNHLVKENAVASVPNLGTRSIGYILPCIYRNIDSGAEEPGYAIIQPNGNLHPYYTKTGYNEMRINASYSSKI